MSEVLPLKFKDVIFILEVMVRTARQVCMVVGPIVLVAWAISKLAAAS